uniref:Uncharacterized protein n=1 Tax=Anguilla anguilla TaxID=7936 RepID=A0A0E9QME3_ANGAN
MTNWIVMKFHCNVDMIILYLYIHFIPDIR